MNPRSARFDALSAALFAAFAGVVHGQAAPDAGQSLRTIPAPASTPPALGEPLHLESPAIGDSAGGESIRFKVRSISLTGKTAVRTAELYPMLRDALGHEVSLSDLHQLADRISAYYRGAGYPLARAYVPAQEVQDGSVEIAIQEGRLGAVQVRNRSALHTARIDGLVGDLRVGSAIARAPLDRRLLALSDTPGVAARGTLRPGETSGTSDLLVDVEDGKRVSGDLMLDNYGQKQIGRYRLSGGVGLNNATGAGDQLSLRALTAGAGLNFGRVGYQIPLALGGVTVGGAYSALRYQLRGQEFAALDGRGTANVGTLHASYPLVRSANTSLVAVLSHDRKTLQDRFDALSSVADRTIGVTGLGLAGDHAPASGAMTRYALTAYAGNLDIRTASVLAADSLSARTDGHYNRALATVSHVQPLGAGFSLRMAVSGQWASKNLDSAEKFALGGPYGVRAYPTNEAAGDKGYVANLEAWRTLGDRAALGLFADAGRVTINKAPFAAGDNHRRVAGYGLAAQWQPAPGTELRAHVARPVSGGAPTTDSERSARLWLQAAQAF